MAEYMILLHGGEFDKYTREQMQEISAKYLAWRKKASGTIRVTGGAPLADEIKSLMGSAPHTKVSDGPYAETKEIIGGYYFVEADDDADLAEFCLDNPHLEHGGRVDIRRVIKVE